jgi:hypothetical protein
LQVVVKQSQKNDSPPPKQMLQPFFFQSLQPDDTHDSRDTRNTKTPDAAMFPKVVPKLHQYQKIKTKRMQAPEWHLQGQLTTLSPRKTALELRG